MSVFSIDYTEYEVGTIKVTRVPKIDRIELGTTLDGTKHYLTKGTYYDYSITIGTRNMNVAEYDLLYEVLTNPTTEHTVTVPYGQSTITINATLSVSNDELIKSYANFKKWGSLTITATALSYSKEAS